MLLSVELLSADSKLETRLSLYAKENADIYKTDSQWTFRPSISVERKINGFQEERRENVALCFSRDFSWIIQRS